MKKPYSIVYKTNLYICIDENEDRLLITNKGITEVCVSRLIVYKKDIRETRWNCDKFCEEFGINWEGVR